jgi:hypothetical protein
MCKQDFTFSFSGEEKPEEARLNLSTECCCRLSHSKLICLLSTTSVSVEIGGKTEIVGKNKLAYLVKIRVLAKQIRLFQEASAKI